MQKWHSLKNVCKQKISWVLKYVEKNFQCQKPKNPIFIIFDCDSAIICRKDFQLKFNAKKNISGFSIRRKEFSMSKTRKSNFYHILFRFSYHTQKWHLVENLCKQKNLWVFKNVEKNFQCQKPENTILIRFSYHMQKWNSLKNVCKPKISWILKYVEKNYQCQKPKNPIFIIFDCDSDIICRKDIQLKLNAKKKISGFSIRRKEFSMSRTRKSNFYHILIRFSYHMQKWHLVENLC